MISECEFPAVDSLCRGDVDNGVSQASECHDCEGADLFLAVYIYSCFNLSSSNISADSSGFDSTRFSICLPFSVFIRPVGESRSSYCYCKI